MGADAHGTQSEAAAGFQRGGQDPCSSEQGLPRPRPTGHHDEPSPPHLLLGVLLVVRDGLPLEEEDSVTDNLKARMVLSIFFIHNIEITQNLFSVLRCSKKISCLAAGAAAAAVP